MLLILLAAGLWIYRVLRRSPERPECPELLYYEETVIDGQRYYQLSRTGALHKVDRISARFVTEVRERIIGLIYLE
jgi:hypothetical protein